VNFKTYKEMVEALLTGKHITNSCSKNPDILRLESGQIFGKTPSLRPDKDWQPYPAPGTYFCWKIYETT